MNREMKMLKMDQKVMLEIKNTVKEMKNVFDELPKRLTQLRTPSPSVIPSCLKSHTQNLAVIYFTSKHFMQGFAKLYKLQFEADIQKL